jgi:hypothetical protein
MAFTSSVSPVKVPTYLVKCCCYNAWERGSISCWSSSGIGSTCVHSQQQHGYPDSISIARIDKRPAYAIDYGFCNRFMTIIRRGRFASTRIATRRTSDFRCCVVWLTVGLSNIITIRCRCTILTRLWGKRAFQLYGHVLVGLPIARWPYLQVRLSRSC